LVIPAHELKNIVYELLKGTAYASLQCAPWRVFFFNNSLRIFIMKKTKTYMDKLMKNKEFREKFDKEYQNLCIGEQVARAQHKTILTQDTLVNRIKNNKTLPIKI
jgi:hypothetical protein